MRATRLPLALLLACLGLAACGGDDSTSVVGQPEPTPAPVPSTAELLAPGEYGVGVTTVVFQDDNRSTVPNGGVPTPGRRLVTEVWYPTAKNAAAPATVRRDAALDETGGPYPLVVYGHGFTDQRLGNAYIGRHLASHGYIVAAPDFPLTNNGAPGGPNGRDLVNQPGDMSFVIDGLLEGAPDARFATAIDEERIAAGGLSFGGLTTLLTTWHATLRDPRIRAAASVAGPGCNFNQDFYRTTDVPLLLLHGDLDAVVPYEAHARFAFGQAAAPKYLVTIADGTHTAFTETAAIIIDQLANADELGCTALGGGRPPEDEEEEFDLGLGGEEIGIIAGMCPASCQGPYPPALRPPRQRDIALATLLAFFEGTLRERAEMLAFLEDALARENPEVAVELEK